MYVIQVDQQSWLRGIWQGWLTTCHAPTGALIYRTLENAENAIDYYSAIAPASKFTVQSLSALAH
jgi:hypothetical protein